MPRPRRVLAWCVGFALVAAVASLLAALTLDRICALVADVPALAARGGFDLLTSRGDVVDAFQDPGPSLWNTSVRCVQQAFGALVAAVLLHRWGCPVLAGRTAGKALTGLRIAPRAPARAALRAAVTTAADVAVYAVACVLLVEGRILLSVLVWAAAVALLLADAVPVLFAGRRSLADRVAGTEVVGVTLGAPGVGRPVRRL
ncbi:hypothetical protein ACIBAI_08810 [Streptomyces sp. NPDC051041]|uniref:hypothetical protein n=1 Tax=Streptomyces sp. NPDC051041 TaxID=3365640 RepID=UPI0037AE1309